MKSRISFFDWTTFKKDVTRFRPLWVLYTVFLLLVMLPTAAGANSYSHPARAVNSTISALSLASFLYGALCAQLLFGELFNSRLCNALHAMPVTREARFGSHLLAGIAFAWIPNLLTTLLMLPNLGQLWYTAFLWFAAYSLQYVFFFGIAVFSVMCTGSRFAMVLVYGIINFLSIVVYWFAEMVYLPMMPGVEFDTTIFNLFCPIMNLLDESDFFRISISPTDLPHQELSVFEGLGESWLYLFIVTAVGIAALASALLMYRKRKLENAGDFIAVNWIAPVFLVLYTLCAGAFLAVFGGLFDGDGYIVLLVLGLIIGCFTGKMLIERTTKVFRKKNFLLAGIFVAALLLSFIPIKGDWFGIVSYVPDTEKVEYVEVRGHKLSRQEFTEQEYIELACQIHRYAIANLEHEDDYSCTGAHRYFHITYHLKNGRTVKRTYYICNQSVAGQLWNKLPNKLWYD